MHGPQNVKIVIIIIIIIGVNVTGIKKCGSSHNFITF